MPCLAAACAAKHLAPVCQGAQTLIEVKLRAAISVSVGGTEGRRQTVARSTGDDVLCRQTVAHNTGDAILCRQRVAHSSDGPHWAVVRPLCVRTQGEEVYMQAVSRQEQRASMTHTHSMRQTARCGPTACGKWHAANSIRRTASTQCLHSMQPTACSAQHAR
eukprot:364469-Chlamydomonas_euryale.AAC.4